MAIDDVQLNDIGTIFSITVKDGGSVVDLSAAAGLTTKQIIFLAPDGTAATQTAQYSSGGDGTDGIITYTSTSGDIDQTGEWKIQGKVVISGNTFHTSVGSFDVLGNLA